MKLSRAQAHVFTTALEAGFWEQTEFGVLRDLTLGTTAGVITVLSRILMCT